MLDGARFNHLIFRLSAVSDWRTEQSAEVVAAGRIGRWHPVVATLRTEKQLDSIDKELRGKAIRLLHAIAREAEARGHEVRLPKRDAYGRVQHAARWGGHMILHVSEIRCSISISQPKDRVPHVPTREEVERDRKYSCRPPQYDYVPADRLSVTIDTESRFSSKMSWQETKTLGLEARRPDVMTTLERWAIVDAQRQELNGAPRLKSRSGGSAKTNLLAKHTFSVLWPKGSSPTSTHGNLPADCVTTWRMWPSASNT